MDRLRPFERTTAIWPVVYLALVGGGLFLFFREWHYDDPFITYRYAANLGEGLGFVYNPGERVLSTTSPLLALLLAGLHLLGADIPTSANLLGALSLAAGGLLLREISRRLDLPAAGWVCALLYPTSALLVSTLGSETPVYLALCLGAVLFYLRGRFSGAAVLLGLAVLTRADALVLGGLLGADWLIRSFLEYRSISGTLRAVPLPAVFASGVILLPWAVFGWIYFGSTLPATLAAKQAQGLLNPADLFLPGLWDLAVRLGEYPHYWILLLLALAGLAIAFRSRPRWLPLLLWPVFFAAGYALLGVPRSPWYFASLVPGAMAAAGLALGTLIESPERLRPRIGVIGRLRAGGVILLALLSWAQLTDLDRLHAAFDDRYAIYREVGLWLAANTPPVASIGTLEVGIIGYFARPRPMIDFAGLLQPEIASQFRPGYRFPQAAAWAAERYQPEVLVLTSGGYRALHETYISGRCEPAAEFTGADFGYDRDIVVYVCG